MPQRANLPGAESLVMPRFEELFNAGKYKEAAELAAESPQGTLRTPAVVQRFQSVPQAPGQAPPLLQYFGTLLAKGGLNAFESVELGKLVLSQNKKQLLENWLTEDKLECSEELGMILRPADPDLALKVFVKAKASNAVIQILAEKGEFDKLSKYATQVRARQQVSFSATSARSTRTPAVVRFTCSLDVHSTALCAP